MNTDTDLIPVPLKPFLTDERELTDESLTAERGKTDDSLAELRQQAESKTDATVKFDRKTADQTRDQLRSDLDFKNPADFGLINQRIAQDKTVQSERSKIDAAIKNERIEKGQALTEFLRSEREETDENLSHERDQTDIAHQNSRAEVTTRDELMAIVSHDLKNPIGSVLSCADMLLEDPAFAAMGTELKYWIELIKRNAETSLRLISDILDMERIGEGKLELHTKRQNLSIVLREAIEPFVHLASTKRILLKVTPYSNDVSATFDRDRINQVLSNLIGNALKFTPEGGSIVLHLQQSEDEAIVSVQDSGVGIPDEEKQRIFGRYAQIANKDRSGIGLGLYISKTLIESHGGRLSVTSTMNQGSTFQFTLPN